MPVRSRVALRFLIMGLSPLAITTLHGRPVAALEYAYETAEPQKSGWPLTPDEEAYVLLPEHERRPGSERKKHLPHLWPVVPSAGSFGGRNWLDIHAKLVASVESHRGPIDVLLVGDSITIQWGDSWTRNFPDTKAVNIGIGGDKTQNVLWRLDHGAAAGLEPRVVILMVGNNNIFFTPETGIGPVAEGIKVCTSSLREKFPKARLIVVKVLPAHAPGSRFYEDIRKTNAAVDGLDLAADPMVQVVDLTADFVEADGTLRANLFAPDAVHLSPAGYDAYAARLRPLIEKLNGP